jgi:hypothetical protein
MPLSRTLTAAEAAAPPGTVGERSCLLFSAARVRRVSRRGESSRFSGLG